MCHPTIDARLWRVATPPALVLCLLLIGVPLRNAVQAEAQLFRYRALMENLTSTVRAMRSQAVAERRTIELQIDVPRGVCHVASVEWGTRPYETLEQTIWMPGGLRISDAPSVVSAFPSGQLSEAVLVVTAPFYRRRFRLTTTRAGLVRLSEEEVL